MQKRIIKWGLYHAINAGPNHVAKHYWQVELDELLAEREKINKHIQEGIDAQTEAIRE